MSAVGVPVVAANIVAGNNPAVPVEVGTTVTVTGQAGATTREYTGEVLAIELMCACQAIDLRGNKGLGVGTQAAYDCVRNVVPYLTEDRPLYGDINLSEELIVNGSLVEAVENAAGKMEF